MVGVEDEVIGLKVVEAAERNLEISLGVRSLQGEFVFVHPWVLIGITVFQVWS